jgi:hypothetical protein
MEKRESFAAFSKSEGLVIGPCLEIEKEIIEYPQTEETPS